MNRLLKLLGYRDREYRGTNYSLRIEPIMREVVAVIHSRQGKSLRLDGERIGRKWEGIQVIIPEHVQPGELPNIVTDLENAFREMGYGYVIARRSGIDTIPEPERQAALAELREMGYEIEVLPDGKIRQTRRADAPCQELETIRRTTARMTSLLQSIHGKRQRFEILAKSKEFQSL